MPSAEYMRTVQASLELGIHPDDESVWPAKRLLCTEGWITTPKKLSLALSHGASPNRGTNWEEGYLCQVLTGIRSCLVDNLTKETEINIADRVRCAELLLKAGSTEIAYPMSKPQQLTAIGYLVNSGSSQALGYTHIHPIIFELMERLQHAGADIDRFGGVMMQPPLIHALRCLNIDGACQLIRMGCKTDDAHIVRTSGLGGIIKPLMVEAHEAGKEAFTTRILAAMMERQLLVSNAKEPTAAANESVSETPRRRMAV